MKKTIIIFTICAVCLMLGAVAFASVYEWITNLHIHNFTGSSDTTLDVHWTVNTTGEYYEYRTACTGLSMSTSTAPASWTRLPGCDRVGWVDGAVNDECNNITFATSTMHRWVRATTNWANCGEKATCYPDIDACGDAMNLNID